MKHSKKGFTLLEMLIAVIIIITLLVMMFYSAAEMKSTARANKVINDMCAWKMAAIMWYHIHKDEVSTDGTVGEVNNKKDMYYSKTGQLFNLEVSKYLDNISKNEIYSGDSKQKLNVFKMKYYNRRWFVCYDVPPDPTIVRPLMAKITSRAAQFGVLKNIEKNSKQDLYRDTNIYDGTQTWMYMEVLDFNEQK